MDAQNLQLKPIPLKQTNTTTTKSSDRIGTQGSLFQSISSGQVLKISKSQNKGKIQIRIQPNQIQKDKNFSEENKKNIIKINRWNFNDYNQI